MKTDNTTTFSAILRKTLAEEMERDDSVIVFGEDVRVLGGRSGLTAGLYERFGEFRVIDTPVVEELFLGIAIGAAELGLRPVVEFGHANLLMLAWSDVYRLGIWRWISANKISLPIVVLARFGAYWGYGAELTGHFLSSLNDYSGFRVVVPSTPAHARCLLQKSLRSEQPVIFLEHAKLYAKTDNIYLDCPDVSLEQASVRKSGNDISILSYGYLVDVVEEAASVLEKENIAVEIIDLVSLKPIDEKTILASAGKTKRVIVVDEAVEERGFFPMMYTMIKKNIPDATVESIGSRPVPLPFGPSERFILPQKEDIAWRIRAVTKRNQ